MSTAANNPFPPTTHYLLCVQGLYDEEPDLRVAYLMRQTFPNDERAEMQWQRTLHRCARWIPHKVVETENAVPCPCGCGKPVNTVVLTPVIEA